MHNGCYFCTAVVHSSCIRQHFHRWMVLLLSSRLGRFHHRSLLALSCGQSDTLPLFRTLGGLPADKFGLFTNLSRCYAAQSVRGTKETKPDKGCGCCQSSSDDKSSDSATDVGVHNDESVSSDAAAASAEHSDKASEVQQTAVDSSELVSQKESLQKVGLVQRFRMMYKQYGVVLVCVHAVTTSGWVSLFYCATVRYGSGIHLTVFFTRLAYIIV